MPKVLLYITARITWIFLFYGTDANENRTHVHVAKRGMERACKIWLEPSVTVADRGELTPAQLKQVLKVAKEQREKLMLQWEAFKKGKPIKMQTIRK